LGYEKRGREKQMPNLFSNKKGPEENMLFLNYKDKEFRNF
jgi:hypothetical protein